MALVAAKCTQCGAALQIENNSDATVCPCCHTPFITEKAIQNYITNNPITQPTSSQKTDVGVQNGSAANQRDFVIVDGVLKKYRGESTKVVIPEGVVEIGECSFYEMKAFTEVVIPDSVTIIGKRAFSGCTGLISVTIPDSVTTIGDEAFWLCSRLTSVTIGNSVTTIGEWIFSRCISLKTIYCKVKKPLFGLPKGFSKDWLGPYKHTGCRKTTVIWKK